MEEDNSDKVNYSDASFCAHVALGMLIGGLILLGIFWGEESTKVFALVASGVVVGGVLGYISTLGNYSSSDYKK
jgi:hypothetical protein